MDHDIVLSLFLSLISVLVFLSVGEFVHVCLFIYLMVFHATFNNISVILWQLVSLVEETGVPGENHRSFTSHWQLYHIMFIEYNSLRAGGKLTTLMVIGTDCIGSYKSYYHVITVTTAPSCLYCFEKCIYMYCKRVYSSVTLMILSFLDNKPDVTNNINMLSYIPVPASQYWHQLTSVLNGVHLKKPHKTVKSHFGIYLNLRVTNSNAFTELFTTLRYMCLLPIYQWVDKYSCVLNHNCENHSSADKSRITINFFIALISVLLMLKPSHPCWILSRIESNLSFSVYTVLLLLWVESNNC